MYNVIGMRKIRGFTLLELLITIGVVAILSATLYSIGPSSRQYARDARRKSDLEQVRSALELYRNSNSDYPVSLPTLVPGFIQSVPTDSVSGRNYYYNRPTATTYYLCSSLEKWTGPTPTPQPGCTTANSCGTGIGCNYRTLQP